jgi:ferric-dicitrate binding protein FerR (iron transport regulator)
MTSSGDRGPECGRFWEVADRRAAGGQVSATEEQELREHVCACPACAASEEMSRLVSDLDVQGAARWLDDGAQDRWVEDVLRRKREAEAACSPAADVGRTASVSSGASRAVPRPSGSSRYRGWAIAAVATLAAAFVAGVVLLGRYVSRDEGVRSQPSDEATFILVSGSVRVAAGSVRPGDPLQVGQLIDVGAGRAGVRLCGRAELYLDAAGRLGLIEARAGRCEVRLESGRVAVDARGLARGSQLVVSTSAGDVRATGTVFVVEVVDGGVEARVLEGSVELIVPSQPSRALSVSQAMRLAGRTSRTLSSAEAERDRQLLPEFVPTAAERSPVGTEAAPPSAPPAAIAQREPQEMKPEPAVSVSPPESEPVRGATARLTEAAPADAAVPTDAARVEPTAMELLDAARRARAASDWPGAAAVYEELTTRFAESPEACVTLVPLGQLRLERLGDAAGALGAFEEYLRCSSSGGLAEEASWGRIEALEVLARPVEEAEAIRAFLAEHPASLRIGQARRRLAELGGAP